jgi:two-component system, chemotaxis family, sensor kinase CheA
LSEQLGAYRAGAEPDAVAAAEICVKLEGLAATANGSEVEAPGREVPDHVIEQVSQVLHPVQVSTPQGACLRITLKTANERDRALLLDEIGNFGRIVKRSADAASLTIWLDSEVAAEDLIAVCCFVIDEDQISVGAGDAAAAPDSPAPEVAAPVMQAPVTLASAPPGEVESKAADIAAEHVAASAERKSRAPTPVASGTEGSSIRVGVEKVDQLVNLVGELVITQAMLAQTASGLDAALHEQLLNGMSQLERNARDLQAAVMSIRMMPMDYVFSRFPRLVRDLAAKLGKQVELVTFGQATELDKGLIERIVDPLTHLVRNSLDHGIETVEKRRAAGKDDVGQLMLSAMHAGGNIVIEVSDDGAGLNRDKILAKAAAQGLPVSDTMRDEEVWNLIFASGFSTADTVTDVSGRGVGMDVVKRNINEMGGHVEISSQAGRGTTTRIVVPLTLAILDGMSVRVGEETFILPLNCVMESLQPRADEIYTVGNGVRLVRVRGEYLPVIALHQVFAVGGARTDPVDGIVTILQSEGRRFALLVDELVGQQQVVVKNLETHYRKVPGVAAATILGDGRVALIVDVAALDRVDGARRIDLEAALPA